MFSGNCNHQNQFCCHKKFICKPFYICCQVPICKCKCGKKKEDNCSKSFHKCFNPCANYYPNDCVGDNNFGDGEGGFADGQGGFADGEGFDE